MKLTILQYNNYFTRIAKKAGNHLSDYSSYVQYSIDNVNFNKGDGVTTTHTINYAVNASGEVQNEDREYNYAIVSNNNDIVSRWFILESKWNRKGQRLLTLRRDLVVDGRDDYKNAPFFCEKAVLAASDSMINNPENMTFSRMLESQEDLGSGHGYVVGYLDRSFQSAEKFLKDPNITTVETITDLPFYNIWTGKTTAIDQAYQVYYDIYARAGSTYTRGTCRGVNVGYTGDISVGWSETWVTPIGADNLTVSETEEFATTYFNQITDMVRGLVEKEHPSVINTYDNNYNNKLFYVRDVKKIYKCSMSKASSYKEVDYEMLGAPDLNPAIATLWKDFWAGTARAYYVNTPNNDSPLKNIKYRYKKVTVTYTAQSDTGHFLTVPQYSDRNHTGKPYDIFVAEITENGSEIEDAATIASILAGSGAIYDLQKVPYVPYYPTGASEKKWTVGSTSFYWLTDTDASGECLTSAYLDLSELTNQQIKEGTISTLWRVCSPNHAASWDFNPYANGGVDKWYYELTLAPFQPYFHVYPGFGGIYGFDTENDIRGLEMRGNFSLPYSSDQMATYMVNNSSYQNAFDRQIENLCKNQNYQKIQQATGIFGGAISAGVTGLASGGAAGAIVGATGSLISGAVDFSMSNAMREESLDYTKDNFGYSLASIDARPNTLSHLSSFDINCPAFPYIEIYVGTDDEYTAWGYKEKYNGWTVQRAGTYMSFANNLDEDISEYIKGQLIRVSGTEDTHFYNELALELYKGIYDQLPKGS